MSGISDISLSYNVQYQPVPHLGMNGSFMPIQPIGPQQGQVSINQVLVSKDNFINFTGENPFNGYVIKDLNQSEDNFSFVSGYLTSYNSRASIGTIPEVNAQIQVYHNIGKIDKTENIKVSGQLQDIEDDNFEGSDLSVSAPQSIELSFINEFNSNRVQSYNLSVQSPRKAIYGVGDRFPKEVNIDYPIEVNFNFVVDVNDLDAQNQRDLTCTPKTGDLVLKLKDLDNDTTLTTYNFNQMFQTSESYQTNTDGNVRLNATYKKFVYPNQPDSGAIETLI